MKQTAVEWLEDNGWVYTKYHKHKLKNLIKTLIGYFVYTLLANVF
jgi:hypothetical protein